MITVHPGRGRGHVDHGWLDARHSFSFASYHDPERMGVGPLRVLNQDRIAPGKGFDLHGHRDMEIVTLVLEGALAHTDSMGHTTTMTPGEVQVMSAGQGVMHSEYNASDSQWLHLLQMWVLPRNAGGAPRYGQMTVPTLDPAHGLQRVVTGDAVPQALTIDQDAHLFVGPLVKGQETTHTLDDGRQAYVHVATGCLIIEDKVLEAGDAATIQGLSQCTLLARKPTQLVLWDLPT